MCSNSENDNQSLLGSLQLLMLGSSGYLGQIGIIKSHIMVYIIMKLCMFYFYLILEKILSLSFYK